MFSRLLRVAASLAFVVAAYVLYSMLAVPWLEPVSAHDRERDSGPPVDTEQLPLHYERLRPYFVEGDWELQNPILVENEQFALMLGDYESLPGGQVQLKPCTLVFFPDGRPDVVDTASRVLILRAEEGAILDFDKDIDLSRAEVGRLRGGRLVGQVTVKGNIGPKGSSSAPGADELWISTRDIDLRPDRMWTPHAVQFRLGRHQGEGRELLMSMAAADGVEGSLDKPRIDAVKSFQLLHDVRLQVELPSEGLLPGTRQTPVAAASGSAPSPDDKPRPLVEISCDGRFRFDVEKMAANFEDGVNVVRRNPAGASERLNCELLTIYFQRPAEPAKAASRPTAPPTEPPTERQMEPPTKRSGLGGALEATRIEARGTPVVVESPAVNGYARGEYLEFDIVHHRLMLNSQQQVLLRYQTGEMEAAQLRYAAGQADATGQGQTGQGQIGQIWAAGPGRLRARLPGNEQDTFEATWTGQLQVRPHGERQLVSLQNQARVAYGPTGSMTADEIWLWLDKGATPIRGPQADPPKDAGSSPPWGRLTPHSLLASGNVQMNSQRLAGATGRLEVWFSQLAAGAQRGSAGSSRASPSALSSLGQRDADDGDHAGANQYHIQGQLIRLKVGLDPDQSPVLQDVTITGDVKLDERPAVEPAIRTTSRTRTATKPLAVSGDELQLVGADTPEAVLTISGQPAHVAARGMAMVGSAVNFERQSNRLWIGGAGKMTLPVDRDLQGQRLAAAEPLDINWQGHMVFDGQTIRFDRDVVATTQQQRLETGQLDVTLNRRIVVGQPVDQDQIGLARIDCRHGVQLESSTIEQGRRTSWERLHTGDLAIEQASGRLKANGPGWISTVRPGSAAKPDSLSFVKVTFQRGAAGNIHQRELVFSDQVRCIYGPVVGWNLELDPAKVQGPQGDEVILTCDQLALRQMDAEPHGRRPVEMEAEGNATVEGETFTAQGHRLTYTTAKELLVLEGTGQTDARLTRQSRIGGPTSQAVAQKIQYWRLKNRVEVQNARFGAGTLDQDR